MRFDWIKFLQFQNMAIPLWETIYMVFISTVISLIIGLPIGILLVTSDEKGVKPNKTIHKILDMIIVNITRSIPFIILMVLLIPLSRMLVHKSYGSVAFIVPLSLGSAPFVARIIAAVIDGYQRSKPEVMWQATIVIIVLVQIIQFIGNSIVKMLMNKRKRV